MGMNNLQINYIHSHIILYTKFVNNKILLPVLISWLRNEWVGWRRKRNFTRKKVVCFECLDVLQTECSHIRITHIRSLFPLLCMCRCRCDRGSSCRNSIFHAEAWITNEFPLCRVWNALLVSCCRRIISAFTWVSLRQTRIDVLVLGRIEQRRRTTGMEDCLKVRRWRDELIWK